MQIIAPKSVVKSENAEKEQPRNEARLTFEIELSVRLVVLVGTYMPEVPEEGLVTVGSVLLCIECSQVSSNR